MFAFEKYLFFMWASLKMSCLFVSEVVTEFFYCNEQESKNKSHMCVCVCVYIYIYIIFLSDFPIFFCGNSERHQLCGEAYHLCKSHHGT